MTSKGVVRCRFCPWFRPAHWTTKGGRYRRGVDALHEHVDDEHPVEFKKITSWARRTRKHA